MAAEVGYVGRVYMTDDIPRGNLPRGKKSAALWVEGFATIFRVIHEMFEAGRIPTPDALLDTLGKLPKHQQKLINAYSKKGAEVHYALEALVLQAKTEWEDEFEAEYCDDGDLGWDKLPVCAKHDFDWALAMDMLVG